MRLLYLIRSSTHQVSEMEFVQMDFYGDEFDFPEFQRRLLFPPLKNRQRRTRSPVPDNLWTKFFQC